MLWPPCAPPSDDRDLEDTPLRGVDAALVRYEDDVGTKRKRLVFDDEEDTNDESARNTVKVAEICFQADEVGERLRDWCISRGGHISADVHVRSQSENGRGVYTSAAVPAGTLLLRLPPACLLHSDMARQAVPAVLWKNDPCEAGWLLPEDLAALALWLLVERRKQAEPGGSSAWKAYLASMPSAAEIAASFPLFGAAEAERGTPTSYRLWPSMCVCAALGGPVWPYGLRPYGFCGPMANGPNRCGQGGARHAAARNGRAVR